MDSIVTPIHGLRGVGSKEKHRALILKKARSMGKSTAQMLTPEQLAFMTHGQINFIRHDGAVAAMAYAYHTGHTQTAFDDLIELPRMLVERWRTYQAFRSSEEARRHAPMVSIPHTIGLMKESFRKSHYDANRFIQDYRATAPDFVFPQASNLANWFCSIHFDHWMIVPEDEQSYPGPNGIVREVGPGVFELEDLSDSSKRILCWPLELVLSMNIYNSFIPDYMRDRFNPE